MSTSSNKPKTHSVCALAMLLILTVLPGLQSVVKADRTSTTPNIDAQNQSLSSEISQCNTPHRTPESRDTIPIDEIYAGECIDYSTHHPYLSSISTGTQTTLVEQVGPLTIVSEYDGRLRIFDLSAPNQPDQVFEMQYEFESQYEHISCMSARDTLLFVGRYVDNGPNFDLFSIADPTQPKLIQSESLVLPCGYVECRLTPMDCWIADDYMYVLAYRDGRRRGFWIYENRDGVFTRTYSDSFANYSRSFVVDQGIVYCCQEYNGLRVYDARDPVQLPVLHSLEFDQFRPKYALIDQGHLHVIDMYGTLGVFDIADPDMEPQLISQTALSCNDGRMNLRPDHTLQIAAHAQGLVDVDVSDPADPILLGDHVLPGGGGDLANGPDGTILATTTDGVWVLTPEGTTKLPQSVVSGWNTRSVAAAGGRIFCGEGAYFRIYHPLPDGQVQLLGEIELPLVATRIFTDNRVAVVDERFFVIDDQVEILNVSDSTNPSVLLTLPIESGSDREVDAAFSGNFVFLAKSGLWIIDTTDISNPVVIHEIPRKIYNIEIKNDVGYVLASSTADYLEVFDLSDPYNIEAVTSLGLDGSLDAMAVAENTVYVSQRLYANYSPVGNYIVVLDVSRADSPQVVDSVSVSAEIIDLRVVGDCLYAGTADGVKTFDISQRNQPELVGQVLGSYVPQISVQDDVLYQVINYHLVTAPAHCQENSSAVNDDSRPDRLPEPILSLGLHPNPFNPCATVSFSLEHADEISVSVFDIRGRLVQILNEGRLASGDHSFTWNGRDRQDRYMPSGTYFFKVSTSLGGVIRKGLLLQ